MAEVQAIVVGGLELYLRPCSSADQGFIYELTRSHLGDFFDRNTIEGWSRVKFRQGFDPKRIVVIEHDGMSVGFFDYELTGAEIYWHNIQLSSDYHGRNVGIKIVRLVESIARESGARTIKGKVFKDNRRMINWVGRLGFEICEEIAEENSYVVRKELI